MLVNRKNTESVMAKNFKKNPTFLITEVILHNLRK